MRAFYVAHRAYPTAACDAFKAPTTEKQISGLTA